MMTWPMLVWVPPRRQTAQVIATTSYLFFFFSSCCSDCDLRRDEDGNIPCSLAWEVFKILKLIRASAESIEHSEPASLLSIVAFFCASFSNQVWLSKNYHSCALLLGDKRSHAKQGLFQCISFKISLKQELKKRGDQKWPRFFWPADVLEFIDLKWSKPVQIDVNVAQLEVVVGHHRLAIYRNLYMLYYKH